MPLILSVLLDLLCVVVFALIGRASHQEALDAAGAARTAAPSWRGRLMGWILILMRRFSGSLWLQGLTIWVMTLVWGMVIRTVLGGGFQLSFVLVAGAFLAVVMFGWRGIAALVLRRRSIH